MYWLFMRHHEPTNQEKMPTYFVLLIHFYLDKSYLFLYLVKRAFQVVDMRWGVRDEATDDHMTTDLCIREIQNCQRLSMGPNFVVRSYKNI